MTNKQNFEKDINVPSKEQIMINGVDVSECKCLHNIEVILEIAKPEDFEILCGATNGAIKCEKWKDCYFKQLARKTQECEEQENKIKKLRKNLALEIESNTHYRKALEEIKEIVKINCEEICRRKFEDCNDFLCPSKNIIDIINKAKGTDNE